MKRKLYPSSRGDRQLFWLTIVGILLSLPLIVFTGEYFWWAAAGVLALSGFYAVYVLQDQPSDAREDEYSAVMAQIKGIETHLSSLSAFLERERKRVADTESTLSKLQEQQAAMEPIVHTQRETVEAILAAHSARIASSAWKERLIGFLVGLFAALSGGMLVEVFKR